MTDEKIEALKLRGYAKKGAYRLKELHPEIEFTSGRRDMADQARAMAQNLMKDPTWMAETYSKSLARERCQAWLDSARKPWTQTDIYLGLLQVLTLLSDDEAEQLSRHLSGDAFDVKPVVENADRIKADIKALDGLHEFREKEGTLIRWHAQFNLEKIV